jgi:hypothetical protein
MLIVFLLKVLPRFTHSDARTRKTYICGDEETVPWMLYVARNNYSESRKRKQLLMSACYSASSRTLQSEAVLDEPSCPLWLMSFEISAGGSATTSMPYLNRSREVTVRSLVAAASQVGPVAQWIEHSASTRRVAGSNPAGVTISTAKSVALRSSLKYPLELYAAFATFIRKLCRL